MSKVAVVILNWNGAEMLRKFLPSVIQYSLCDEVDIYVADNASTDNSIEIVSKEFPLVKLLCFEENYGFAEGYNRVMAMLETEYVVLLNNDVEVTERWLAPIIEFMDANSEVVACQPKILSFKNKEYFEYAGASGGFIDRYGYPFCRGRIFDTVEKDEGQYDSVVEIFWASGAALFIRRNIYIEAGGLDSTFFAHMEEIDLCWRLCARGYKLACVPQSKVYHVGGATLKKENPRKTYLNFRNNLLMLYKNLPDSELSHVMSIRTILDYIAILMFILKFDWKNARAVLKARSDYRYMRCNYLSAREINMNKSVVQVLPGRYNFSLVLKNKLFGCKKYSDFE